MITQYSNELHLRSYIYVHQGALTSQKILQVHEKRMGLVISEVAVPSHFIHNSEKKTK